MEAHEEDKKIAGEEREGSRPDKWLRAFTERFTKRYREDLAELAAIQGDQEG